MKLLLVPVALVVLGGAFATGVAGGVYYHREITVLWHGITADVDATQPQVAAVIDEAAPHLELPGIEGPLPLVYSDTLEEEVVQEYLKEGAVVLPLGASFGEPGNVVVTAHSTGTEAFGPYRFAFAKLSELEEGDEYTVRTPVADYRYRVYAKEVVWPHQVDRLPNDDRSTVTLVTCWPLWTNFKRLLVHTELVGVDYRV